MAEISVEQLNSDEPDYKALYLAEKARADAAEAKWAEEHKKYLDAESNLDDANAYIGDLTKKVKALETKVQNRDKKLEIKDKFISDLMIERKSYEKTIAALESGDALKEIRAQYEKEIARLQTQVAEGNRQLLSAYRKADKITNEYVKTCDDLQRDFTAQIDKYERDNTYLQRLCDNMSMTIDKFKERIKKIRKEYKDLLKQIGPLKKIEKKYNDSKKKDYTNTNNSSSCYKNHGKIVNSRVKTGAKPGKVPGTPGTTLQPAEKCDRVVDLDASIGKNGVPNFYDVTRYIPTGKVIMRQVLGFRIVSDVVNYTATEYMDLETGKTVHAPFPANCNNPVNYSSYVKALALHLNVLNNVSMNGVAKILNTLSNGLLHVSDGTIYNWIQEFATKTEDERNKIFEEQRNSDYLHADFTFGREDGRLTTILIGCTHDSISYTSCAKKGKEAISGSPLDGFHGTLTSDHESTFVNLDCKHQECLTHVNRHSLLIVVTEKEIEWAQNMIDWIKGSIHYRNETVRNMADFDKAAHEAKVAELSAKYDEILKQAEDVYSKYPQYEEMREGYNLYKRMKDDKQNYIRFLYDLNVDPTNNKAERAARKLKRKMAEIMCFRSTKGKKAYCNCMTVLQTYKLRNGNDKLFDTICEFYDRSRPIKPKQKQQSEDTAITPSSEQAAQISV